MKHLTILVLPIFLMAFAVNADVRCVQEYLSESAFDPGPIDGAWGRKTATALEGFVAQVGINIEGGLGKDNASEQCRVFQADTAGKLLLLGKYRHYPATVDQELLKDIDPTFFDFSGMEIYDGPDLKCGFQLLLDGPKRGERWNRVKGRLEIVSGRLKIENHAWSLGHDQVANESYLQERSNLALLSSGRVVGRMPFFWKHIQEGEVSNSPSTANATPASTYEGGGTGTFPRGKTVFEIPTKSDMMAVLSIVHCQKI